MEKSTKAQIVTAVSLTLSVVIVLLDFLVLFNFTAIYAPDIDGRFTFHESGTFEYSEIKTCVTSSCGGDDTILEEESSEESLDENEFGRRLKEVPSNFHGTGITCLDDSYCKEGVSCEIKMNSDYKNGYVIDRSHFTTWQELDSSDEDDSGNTRVKYIMGMIPKNPKLHENVTHCAKADVWASQGIGMYSDIHLTRKYK